MKIEMGKQYRLRDGREARVLMTDGGDWKFPIIAAYKDNDGLWWPLHLTKEGRANPDKEDYRDLVEVKPRIQLERWMVVRRTVFGDVVTSTAPTKEMALELAKHNFKDDAIALVKVDIDVEEGHGL